MSATFDMDRPVSHRGGARTLSLPGALGLSWVIARRALDLAHDRGVSTAEGTEHLTRLADHRDLPLRVALAHLRPDDPPDTARGHACTLLELAIDALTGGCVRNGQSRGWAAK